MSCAITSGRGLTCKDAVGGLKNVYFVNKSDVPASGIIVSPTTGVCTQLASPPVDGWKYELHLGNDLTQNIQSSIENGTVYIEQVLSLTLKKMTASDNEELLNIAKANPVIIVEDNMGNFWVAGLYNGMDVTGGTAVTGNAFGDMNGYTLTLTGMEASFASAYSGFDTDIIVNGV